MNKRNSIIVAAFFGEFGFDLGNSPQAIEQEYGVSPWTEESHELLTADRVQIVQERWEVAPKES